MNSVIELIEYFERGYVLVLFVISTVFIVSIISIYCLNSGSINQLAVATSLKTLKCVCVKCVAKSKRRRVYSSKTADWLRMLLATTYWLSFKEKRNRFN